MNSTTLAANLVKLSPNLVKSSFDETFELHFQQKPTCHYSHGFPSCGRLWHTEGKDTFLSRRH